MNADGSGQTNLTRNPEFSNAFAAWSPDGSQIVFHVITMADVTYTDDLESAEIYVMNSDGSGRTRLTDVPGEDSGPNWGPRPSCVDDTSGDQEQGPVSGPVHDVDDALGSGSGEPAGTVVHQINCELIAGNGL